ncbi:hypothetical protein [Bradyrhizobium neotropicale]|uniref:hypothetical protein n=1 Tax=Bradyrhizobium neotropicale TaxID=1497615 RepID=UPI001AD744A2|nr:hypothetical protein [Bradyrhizobium neotropicale]MBO4221922.1 hypothetical protein [Bradyrhizobium neotropicale]
MGDKKRRKQAFLAAHPICCFCGGNTPATTEDHVPARGIFDGRQWPEGYSFPACEPCNGLTRHDEKIVAMLARLLFFDDNETELQSFERRRAMDAVRQAFPEAYRAMRLKPNEVRAFLKRTGRTRDGYETLGDIPIISIGQPIFMTALRSFAAKLFCALHYKHTGRIVPTSGVIVTRFLSNAQVFDGMFPKEVLSLVGNPPDLRRARTSLNDQFGYEYKVAEESTISLFACGFRQSFAMIGMVSEVDDEPPHLEEKLEYGAFRSKPFRHT